MYSLLIIINFYFLARKGNNSPIKYKKKPPITFAGAGRHKPQIQIQLNKVFYQMTPCAIMA